MTDDMLRALARNGGVCMINFFSAFVNDGVAEAVMRAQRRVRGPRTEGGTEELPNDSTDWDEYLKWFNALGCPTAKLDDVVNHVMHAVQVAGIDHVGIGSDFDGVPALPEDLQTAASLPLLTARLLELLSESDVEKILGGNFMRAFAEIEGARASRPHSPSVSLGESPKT